MKIYNIIYRHFNLVLKSLHIFIYKTGIPIILFGLVIKFMDEIINFIKPCDIAICCHACKSGKQRTMNQT